MTTYLPTREEHERECVSTCNTCIAIEERENEWLDERRECACGYRAFDLTDHECYGPTFEVCRPDEYPPYPTPREVHDREVSQFVAEARVSPWVRRAQADDLPTFSTHNGAFAYRR